MSTSVLVSQETSLECLQSSHDGSVPDLQQARIMQLTKYLYQVDQQEKFLSLQAEVESLIGQLQSMKAQKETVVAQRSTRS